MSKRAALQRNVKAGTPQKACPQCSQVVHVRTRQCPKCEHIFPVKSGRGKAGDADSKKCELIRSISFIIENLERLDGKFPDKPIRLQDVLDAPTEKRLELLDVLDFQKKAKQHLQSINTDDLERLIAVLKSIFAGWK